MRLCKSESVDNIFVEYLRDNTIDVVEVKYTKDTGRINKIRNFIYPNNPEELKPQTENAYKYQSLYKYYIL